MMMYANCLSLKVLGILTQMVNKTRLDTSSKRLHCLSQIHISYSYQAYLNYTEISILYINTAHTEHTAKSIQVSEVGKLNCAHRVMSVLYQSYIPVMSSSTFLLLVHQFNSSRPALPREPTCLWILAFGV